MSVFDVFVIFCLILSPQWVDGETAKEAKNHENSGIEMFGFGSLIKINHRLNGIQKERKEE